VEQSLCCSGEDEDAAVTESDDEMLLVLGFGFVLLYSYIKVIPKSITCKNILQNRWKICFVSVGINLESQCGVCIGGWGYVTTTHPQMAFKVPTCFRKEGHYWYVIN
jgi:hypothetical protein